MEKERKELKVIGYVSCRDLDVVKYQEVCYGIFIIFNIYIFVYNLRYLIKL